MHVIETATLVNSKREKALGPSAVLWQDSFSFQRFKNSCSNYPEPSGDLKRSHAVQGCANQGSSHPARRQETPRCDTSHLEMINVLVAGVGNRLGVCLWPAREEMEVLLKRPRSSRPLSSATGNCCFCLFYKRPPVLPPAVCLSAPRKPNTLKMLVVTAARKNITVGFLFLTGPQ